MLYLKTKRWLAIIPIDHFLQEEITGRLIDVYEKKLDKKTTHIRLLGHDFFLKTNGAWLFGCQGELLENHKSVATIKGSNAYEVKTVSGSYLIYSRICWNWLKSYDAIQVRCDGVELGQILRFGVKQSDSVESCYEKLPHVCDRALVLYLAFRLSCQISSSTWCKSDLY